MKDEEGNRGNQVRDRSLVSLGWEPTCNLCGPLKIFKIRGPV